MTGSCATQSPESYARPVSRGTRRAAAVKPRPTVFSPSTPRPMGAVRSPEALLLARGPLPSGGLCHPISGKSHQTGEPWHLLCHGGKTRPTVFSPSTPRPMGAVRSPEALLLARGPLPSGGLCHPISGKSHQTGEPWHLLCHGGKTPANRLPLERPRALWARFGVQRRCPWGVAHETADGYVAADDHP